MSIKEFVDSVLETFEAKVAKDCDFGYVAVSPHVTIFGNGKTKKIALNDLFEQICFYYVELRFNPVPLGKTLQEELVNMHWLLKESGFDRLEEIEQRGEKNGGGRGGKNVSSL